MNSKKLNNGVVEFVQNYFFMLVLAIILFGFSAFKVAEERKEAEVTFTYNSSNFSENEVEDTSNWVPLTGPSCDPEHLQEVACSITVPLASTMTSGSEIDPNKVIIDSEELSLGSNNYRVIESLTGDYTDPINKQLP